MFTWASYPMQPPPPSIFIMGLDDSFIRLTNSIVEHTCTLVEHQFLWISLLRRYTNLPQSQCPLWKKKRQQLYLVGVALSLSLSLSSNLWILLNPRKFMPKIIDGASFSDMAKSSREVKKSVVNLNFTFFSPSRGSHLRKPNSGSWSIRLR